VPRSWRRYASGTVLRSVVITAVLVALYYVLPFDSHYTGAAVAWLTFGVAGVALLLALQSRAVARSAHPQLRAVEALASVLPLFLLIFATTYRVMEQKHPGSFTAHLTRTDALYFSVTVFSTVGFGDIAAISQSARIAVTFQMISDLVLVGVGLRAITAAVRVGAARSADGGDDPSG
jgi:Ion channel